MYRFAIEELKKWKNNKNRKPLIIRGARQSGKTWLMKEFGSKEYKNIAYVNFDGNIKMHALFEMDYDIKRIIDGIELETEQKIDSKNTLIIFDEVQEVPKALASLKYFYENHPEYNIVAAGSLLGVALHEKTSFPVGKVEFLDLYPMNFYEFLLATDNEKYYELLKNNNIKSIKTFSSSIIDLLKKYYVIGGMPEVVANYASNKDYQEVRVIQNRILDSYEQDFSKHAPNNIVPRIRMLWNSIPSQLSKDNKKFIYGLIKEGARAKEYELALSWLIDCGLIYKINRINKAGLPLKYYEDISYFKLFMLDVGLFSAKSEIDIKTILENDKIFIEYKGSCAEEYVVTQLITNKSVPLYYYLSDNSRNEIDFIFDDENYVIPIEVKSSTNLQSKSLKFFIEKNNIEKAVGTSLADFEKNDIIVNIPLYMINNILELL